MAHGLSGAEDIVADRSGREGYPSLQMAFVAFSLGAVVVGGGHDALLVDPFRMSRADRWGYLCARYYSGGTVPEGRDHTQRQ